MTETTLLARSAFGSTVDDGWDGFRACERLGRTRASVAARHGAHDRLAVAVWERFGRELPGPGRRTGDDALAFAFSGLGQWFAEADAAAFSDLAATLADALGDNASITDQSDAWTELHLSGTHAREVLARLCPLDLHATRFPPGATARTVMEHIGAFITCTDAAPAFVLLTPVSTARSFYTNLRHAADGVCGPR